MTFDTGFGIAGGFDFRRWQVQKKAARGGFFREDRDELFA
jgi:hypothetical protein